MTYLRPRSMRTISSPCSIAPCIPNRTTPLRNRADDTMRPNVSYTPTCAVAAWLMNRGKLTSNPTPPRNSKHSAMKRLSQAVEYMRGCGLTLGSKGDAMPRLWDSPTGKAINRRLVGAQNMS